MSERYHAETQETTTSDQFDRVLKRKFGLVRGVSFRSDLPRVEAISVVPGPIKAGATAPETLYVIPYYVTPDGKERHETFTLTADGTLLAKLPKTFREQGISNDAVLREIIERFERLGLNSWRNVNIDILPPGEWPGSVGGSEAEPKKGWYPPWVDDRRLEFIRTQKGFLFGFTNTDKGGFLSYHVAVFPTFLVLDHPETHNALFVLDIPPIDTAQLPQTEEETDEFVRHQPWAEWLVKSKGELKNHGGAAREVHSGDWQVRVQALIDERMKKAP